MGTAPTSVLVSAAGAGNSADGAITRDAIDDLIGAMSAKLLIYLRAKKMSTIRASFVDALGNAVSCNYTSLCTFNSSDSNFSNHASVLFGNSSNNMYTMAAGGIGIGTPPVAMTNSFTIMAGIHAGNDGSNCLYGDTAGTTNIAGTGFYLSSAGNLIGSIGYAGYSNLTFSGTQPLLAAGSTGVIWVSYDAATNLVRAGCNSTAVQLQATSTYTRTGAGTGTICYPFGIWDSGAGGDSGNQSFNRWTLWNKAFMNGSVSADDAAFTNLVTQYATYV